MVMKLKSKAPEAPPPSPVKIPTMTLSPGMYASEVHCYVFLWGEPALLRVAVVRGPEMDDEDFKNSIERALKPWRGEELGLYGETLGETAKLILQAIVRYAVAKKAVKTVAITVEPTPGTATLEGDEYAQLISNGSDNWRNAQEAQTGASGQRVDGAAPDEVAPVRDADSDAGPGPTGEAREGVAPEEGTVVGVS